MNLEESFLALGLKPGATLRDVRRAYYHLVKRVHPDQHHADPELVRKATEETKILNLAYEHVCKVFWTDPRLATNNKRKRDRSSGREGSGSSPIPGKRFIVPSCGMNLNWVAAGRFRMGSSAEEAGRSNDEGPQTEVRISRGFWLGRFAVTQEEWKALAECASHLKNEPSYFKGERLPVEQVSWNDCQEWLQELNNAEETENRLPQGFRYRLPTEAEWEFACRAGTSSRFYFGAGDDELEEYAWFSGNARSQSHPVGEKKPNAWGFYDMHGNVWEWCQDRYGGPLPGGSVTDPKGSASGMNMVLRGGAWGTAAPRCRTAYRVWNKPHYRDFTLGFRVALAP